MRNFVRIYLRVMRMSIFNLMNKSNILRVVLLAAAAFAAVSCGSYNKLLKSKDKEKMYQAALQYYEEGKFDKTLQLFEEIDYYYKGTNREDTILFMTANSHYQERDYLTSCEEFDDFRRRFGRSGFVEEAEYKYAMGYYYMTPPANRDQSYTYLAMSAISEYLERYPESLKKQLCLARLDELQGQLYDKSFYNARTYYKIGRYKSAVMALRNALKEYPQTPHREEILYLILESSYELAANSIPSLQHDRYLNVMDSYYTFVAEFPDSSYRRDADRMLKETEKYLAANGQTVAEKE